MHRTEAKCIGQKLNAQSAWRNSLFRTEAKCIQLGVAPPLLIAGANKQLTHQRKALHATWRDINSTQAAAWLFLYIYIHERSYLLYDFVVDDPSIADSLG